MINRTSCPLQKLLKVLLAADHFTAVGMLMDIHPLLKHQMGGIDVFLDQPLDNLELGVSTHARILEVLYVHFPPVNHIVAAGVDHAVKTSVEVSHSGGEPGAELDGEVVGVGVSPTAHEGNFEGYLVGHVFAVDDVVDVHLNGVDGELGEL